MLNSLASYLLGYPAAVASEAAAAAEATPAETTASTGLTALSATTPTPVLSAQVPQDVELFTKEADDDWLLIERNDDDSGSGSESGARISGATGSSPSSAVAIPTGATVRLTLAVSTYPRSSGEADDASGTFSSMDESWFVTPPPCFTSGSVPVETSPLENLLIEHPSMSVYHRSPVAVQTPVLSSSVGAVSTTKARAFRKLARNNKQQPEAIRPAAVTETAAPAPAPVTAVPEAGPGERSPARTESATAVAPNAAAGAGAVQASPRSRPAYSPYQQTQQAMQIRSAQKLVQRATCQLNKRDSMERTNKAREILSSRNKRQRRSDRMNNHSGANNNRKC